MGILSSMFSYSMNKIGASPIYVLTQDNKSWARMHEDNLLRYLRFRGFEYTKDVEQRLKIMLKISPEMTFRELVDGLEKD